MSEQDHMLLLTEIRDLARQQLELAQQLRQLSDLLDQIRQRQGLKEKKLGIFYRKSKSFLHFHEDPAGIFADISSGTHFHRYPVNSTKEQRALLAAIDRALK